MDLTAATDQEYTVLTYIGYLAISIFVTLLVGWTLHRNGRGFLVEVFQGNTELANSVNHLIVVGFYLFHIGFVTLALKYGTRPTVAAEAIEALAAKVGLVLLVMGVLHLFNLILFSRLRWRVRIVDPTGHLAGTDAPAAEGVERVTMSCPTCHRESEGLYQFCVHCGASMLHEDVSAGGGRLDV